MQEKIADFIKDSSFICVVQFHLLYNIILIQIFIEDYWIHLHFVVSCIVYLIWANWWWGQIANYILYTLISIAVISLNAMKTSMSWIKKGGRGWLGIWLPRQTMQKQLMFIVKLSLALHGSVYWGTQFPMSGLNLPHLTNSLLCMKLKSGKVKILLLAKIVKKFSKVRESKEKWMHIHQ